MKKVLYFIVAVMAISLLFASEGSAQTRAWKKANELYKKSLAAKEAKRADKGSKEEGKTKIYRHKPALAIQADRPNYARTNTVKCEGGVCGGRADRQRYMGRIASTNRW